MSNLAGKVRDALHSGRLVDADRLLNRLEAVERFRRAVDGLLPESRLGAAHTLVERAEARLALSRDHTVVALAGATGSGKSSLFNALARWEMSPVGVRRPTTGVTHACVWGPLAEASKLLDWVGVLPRHRFVRESALDGDDELALHGLILLDLPDFDSVQRTHRSEVDRLLGLVDLVVWVVDPQKYADRVVHASYLRDFDRHQDVTVVVLNQADRLPPAEVPRVVADLRRILATDQLDQVPVLATSTLNQAGIADLRATLERSVSERQAALSRLSADVDVVVGDLAALVGPPAGENDIDRRTTRRLTETLAGSAGVPAVAEATRSAYVHRASTATGWPVVRGWRKLRPDPLRRLHLPGAGGTPRDEQDRPNPVPVTSLPDPTAAQRAAVGLAVRAISEQAGSALPDPWTAAVAAAARSRLGDLPDALDRAVASTDLGLDRRPLWWRLVGGVQWLAILAALGGLGWLILGYALRALGLPALDYPAVGSAPVPTLMLLGGLLLGLVVALLVKPIIGWAARRAGGRAEERLHTAVSEVGRELVVTPVREVLRRYAQAREALALATTGR
ncbi:GTP-binding protein EngB required for normal cell division [Micromonospora pisi]|uniref:GTP-binding protein EngB required for normal cell division n=1 Tax=Micromonospora pisi TaxID=589240 RepID=A0A495JJN6_9ACTN|nr:GTPase [Micromonospora pisi]RKR89137.1 GTP-binding protein EngB required for normal cell division [Micromonospora pisi]